jgi:shikimate kinase
MKNIILTGFMGTGKTSVGKELSRLLSMQLVDVDTEIENAEQLTINEIFGKFGEARFREIETEMIKTVARKKNVIISTGGGAVMKQDNMNALRESGMIICLMATPETILHRTSKSNDRPLLRGENPLEKIRELLDIRMPFYKRADIIIDTERKTPLHIAEEIIESIQHGKDTRRP